MKPGRNEFTEKVHTGEADVVSARSPAAVWGIRWSDSDEPGVKNERTAACEDGVYGRERTETSVVVSPEGGA